MSEIVPVEVSENDVNNTTNNLASQDSIVLYAPLASNEKYGVIKLTDIDTKISNHNISATSHQDIRTSITNQINAHNDSDSAHIFIQNKISNNESDITAIKAEQTTQNTNIQTNTDDIGSHISNINNPHQVTKAQIGLGNVDNTNDLSKPVSTATQTELNKKVDKTTTTDVSVNKIVNSGSYPYGIGILSNDKTDVNGIYSSVGVDKDKILLASAKTGATSNLTFTPDKLELIQSNSNAGTYLRSNVATENYVDTSVQNAISGAVIYKGIWTTTTQTATYSALNSFRPIKSGWRWEVGGTGCTIDNVQYLPTDFITFNQDCGEDTTITTAMIDKTDNTDGVTSVNGQVGNVVLSASDVGATAQSYVDTQDTNLQTQITTLQQNKLNITQGLENANRNVITDSSGNITFGGSPYDYQKILVQTNVQMLNALTDGGYADLQIVTPEEDSGYKLGHLYQFRIINDEYSWVDITPKTIKTQITIAVADWANNQATKAISSVTSNNAVWVSPTSANYLDYANAQIRADANQVAGQLTFICSTTPTVDITVNVITGV